MIDHQFSFVSVGLPVVLKEGGKISCRDMFFDKILCQCACMLFVGARQRHQDPGRSPGGYVTG